MQSLAGKIALVTGGTRGIGRAVARMLLQEDAQVILTGRDSESASRAALELSRETGGKVEGKAADVRSYEQVGELFQFIDQRFGALDVLVNNAGVGVFRPVSELSIEEWKQVVETNLTGAFHCSREALLRFGTRNGGSIVNIGSLASKNAFAGGAAYNASKFGMAGFSEAMMQDVRNVNVRVSFVMPGSVATDFGSAPESGKADSGKAWKIWPEDVAEIVKLILQMPARTLVSTVEVRPSSPPKGGK